MSCFTFQTKSNYNIEKLRESIYECFLNISRKVRKEEIDKIQFHSINNSENEFKCYDITKLNYLLHVIIKLSSKITLHEIETLELLGSLIIKHDISIECNKPTNLNIYDLNYIAISGNINVKMNNFVLQNCERTDDEYCTFHIVNKAKLTLNNILFKNNTNETSFIFVDGLCTLEMNNCTFDTNRRFLDDEATCIDANQESKVILTSCHFMNHGELETPFEKSDCLIMSAGHVTIDDCFFTNNKSDVSDLDSFNFSNEANVDISNSTFKKCSIMKLQDNCKISLNDCIFEQCGDLKYPAGCILLKDNSQVEAISCNFNSNIASQGGSILCKDKSKIKLESCNFVRNRTIHKLNGDGGALLLTNEASGIVDRCVFKENRASVNGGAISLWDASTAEICNCEFDKNISSERKSNAIYYIKKTQIREFFNRYNNSSNKHLKLGNYELNLH